MELTSSELYNLLIIEVKQLRAKKFIGKLKNIGMATEIFPIVIHLMLTSGMLTSGIQKQLKYTKEGVSHGVWHIEHLKRWIKKAWQCAIVREHMKKAIFQFRPCHQ